MDMDTVGAVPVWTLSDRLVKARRHADLTQEDLADRLGITARTIYRYESGAPVKRGAMLGWALACGVDPGWLEHGGGDTGTPLAGATGGDLRRPVPHVPAASAA